MKWPLILFFILFSAALMAQDDALHPPLSGELILSGNFGEVRGNHFHSGIDLKTGGREGRQVFAIQDGRVSRIVVSPTGFGKALYIDHPDGTTSVYAHLQQFAPEIAAFVKEEQYRRHSFRIDRSITDRRFPIRKGQEIAKSGNSGSSGGPHVHFEVRKTNGQIPQNPLNYGFEVRDERHPELTGLWIYEHSGNGHISGIRHEKQLELNGASGNYDVAKKTPVEASGLLSFGIGAKDRFSSSWNVCGIYTMTVNVNGKLLHAQRMDAFPFSKKRMVNCHVDYHKRHTLRTNVYRSYIAPGNSLSMYEHVENNGVIRIQPDSTYHIEVRVEDHAGNRSSFSFQMVGKPLNTPMVQETPADITDLFFPDRENSFVNNAVRVNLPKNALYDTLPFHYGLKPACAACVAPVHSIGKLSDTPLDRYMTVSIRLDRNTENLDNALVVSFDKNDRPIAEGGTVKWNWITARTRSFGDYSVMIDSLAPELRPKNFKDGTRTYTDTLVWHLEDDLSGISSIEGTLNGEWVLLEHDPKTSRIYYVKDERFLDGQNTFRLKATDEVGNEKELSVTVR